MTLTQLYSGVVINQNATPRTMYPWRANGGNQIFQTFYLPDNYQLGSADPIAPDISGFQVLVEIDTGYAQSAAIAYTMDYFDVVSGWNNLASGTSIGAFMDGTQMWL